MSERRKTVLVVVAHADDMEFMAAGTVARFVDECGYDVYEYILTDNRRGSYRLPEKDLIQVSAKEAVEAGKILGLKEVRLEGYPDGELNETLPNVLRDKIMAMIREVRADIVMGWDPFAPCEDHPDHRTVAMALSDAAAFSNNPKYHPEHANPPYPVTEAYWFAKHPWEADCFVDITSTIEKKISALLAHDCQMVFTMDCMREEAQALQADFPMLDDSEGAPYRELIAAGIRNFAAEKGAAHGMEFAEQFRYQRLGMIDTMLGASLTTQDFLQPPA